MVSGVCLFGLWGLSLWSLIQWIARDTGVCPSHWFLALVHLPKDKQPQSADPDYWDVWTGKEAQTMYERALEASERVLGGEHPSTLVSVNNLATLLESKGDYAGAQPLSERALEASERVLGAEHPNTLGSANNLAFLLYSKGDYAGAQPLYERALEARERVLGAEHPDTLLSVNNLALLLLDMGSFDGAERLLRRSMEVTRRTLGPVHEFTANVLASYSMALSGLHSDTHAESFAREALQIWQRSGNPGDYRSGKAHWVLGSVAARRGDRTASQQHLREALHMLLKGRDERHPWVVAVKKQIEKLK